MKTKTKKKKFSVLTVSGLLRNFDTFEEAEKQFKGYPDGTFQISEYDEEGKFVKRL